MLLYHTGFQEIRDPDVHFSRANADFGQGFYLTPDRDFAERWARSRRGRDTWLNAYELDMAGLRVLRLERNEAWYDCIFKNRAGLMPDMGGADVVIGPIANDTIYNVAGVLTSGLLMRDQALALLRLGPEYRQVALRTEAAAKRLRWLSARRLEEKEIARCREQVRAEEAAYLELFSKELERLMEGGAQRPPK